MFEEQMSHDSRRELYEIFRLNYTKLNIILKKDGAYNGEKCPRRRANNSQQPTANKQQHGGHERPAERDANELTTDEHRDCTTNSKANSKRTQRNSRQRTSSGKQNTRCLSVRVIGAWVCVGVVLVAGDGGCVLPACLLACMCVFGARSVRFGVRLATRWPLASRASNMCACLCMVRCQTKTSTKTPTNRSEGHTKTRMLYESNKH